MYFEHIVSWTFRMKGMSFGIVEEKIGLKLPIFLILLILAISPAHGGVER